MSSVCVKLDFESSSCNGSHFGCEESSQESSDGDETGYRDQTVNEESADESNLGSLPPSSSEDEDKDENLTTELVVLIPAVKGSREKHGLSLGKSSVTWADDVYDPPPSIASHTRSKKKPHSSKSKDNHKKTSKKGQKSKDSSSSRGGSSSKDKKHSPRKHSREKFDWGSQVPIVAASS